MRYIGAGAVATGGLITLLRSVPIIVESVQVGARQFQRQVREAGVAVLGTDSDLSLHFVVGGAAVIILAMAVVPHVFGPLGTFAIRLASAVLVVICVFFFVTVSSRIVGLVGVTSNPTSGMTIASLLSTSLVFLLMGWTGDVGKVGALSVGCIVAIAASVAGDTSQDLKTGFLLGATPRRQQIGEVRGVLTSVTLVCLAVLLLDQAYGLGTDELPVPQATLMKVVIEGVLQGSLPWALVGMGVGLALVAELLHIPSLPFAVGVYLPVSTMVPVFLGGLLRCGLEKSTPSREEARLRRERGIIFGSGLVGGEGLLGVGIASVFIWGAPRTRFGHDWLGPASAWVALAVFGVLVVAFVRNCRSGRPPSVDVM